MVERIVRVFATLRIIVFGSRALCPTRKLTCARYLTNA